MERPSPVARAGRSAHGRQSPLPTPGPPLYNGGLQESAMAKGQKKSNKEIRKPKADKKAAAAPASRFIEVPGKK